MGYSVKGIKFSLEESCEKTTIYKSRMMIYENFFLFLQAEKRFDDFCGGLWFLTNQPVTHHLSI